MTERYEAIDHLIFPFQKFLKRQASGGIVLLAATFAALLLANSQYSTAYHEFWNLKVHLGFGGLLSQQPLHFWVNDALMAIFFFLVGLEIKREILAGELAGLQKAMLPLMAALGGMVVPAGIYLAINASDGNLNGFGVPMATDIAFAIGVITILGDPPFYLSQDIPDRASHCGRHRGSDDHSRFLF